jgi:hypothetical protein
MMRLKTRHWEYRLGAVLMSSKMNVMTFEEVAADDI